jgi:DNA-binding CsgD family transcriptional regulator
VSGISIQAQSLINAMQGYVLVKDLQSQYISCGTSIAGLFNIKNQEDISLFNDFSIPHEVNKYGGMFVAQDKKVKSLQHVEGVYSIYHTGKLRAHQFYKSVVPDLIEGQAVILAQSIEIKDSMLAGVINNLVRQPDSLVGEVCHKNQMRSFEIREYPTSNLTKRQAHCLFYIIRGHSANAIAKFLNLSKRTVESYIEEIKIKMRCNSRQEIIEKSIAHGYIDIVPIGLDPEKLV